MVKKISGALHQKNSLTGASVILIITLFLSNVLGVLRDHYLTQKIPTDNLSVYYAAFRIPDLIFNLLILGAITSAFIPVFTNLITKKKVEEAWKVASSVINIAVLFLIVVILLLYLLMPTIVPLFVPGFEPEKQELTINLARIMLASPLFFSLSYIVGGILNSFKRFLAYAIAPLVYNLSIILGTVLFAEKYNVTGVAIAVVVGAFLHFLVQLPVAIRLGFSYKTMIDWKNSAVKRIGILMLPRAIALGANQIMLLIFTAVASAIGSYAVAVYNLADNIQTMPMVVFGTSFATAIFPNLAESIAQEEKQEFSRQIERVMRIILFFLIPITFMLILLRTEIVRIILGSGFFGWEQTIITSNTLGIFAISLVFTGLTPLFSRAFYAMNNTKVPMIIMILNVLISIFFAKLFVFQYGVLGLAMGFSAGAIISTIILYALLRRKTILNEKAIFYFVLKVLFASLLMAGIIQESKLIIGMYVDMQRFWGVALKTFISLGLGLSVYLTSCWIFSCEEMNAIKILFRKFNGKGIDAAEIE